MTAKVLLYTLILVIVISTAFMNTFYSAARTDSGVLVIIGVFIFTALFTLGLISLFLKAAARWRRVGGVLFLFIALMAILALPSYYHDRGGSFTDYPFLLLPYLAVALSWAISGVLVWRGAESED